MKTLAFLSPKGTECWLTLPDRDLISIFYVDGIEHARFQVIKNGNNEAWKDEKGQIITPHSLGKTLFAIAKAVDELKK